MLERTPAELAETRSLVVDTARAFAREKLAPGAAARERARAIEPEIIAALGELGFLGATVDPEWGGAGLDYLTYAMALEEIAAGDGAVSTLVSVHNAPTCLILERFGTPAQRERFLRPMATGKAVSCFALTEPQAGSDASALRTRAVRDGDSWVIDGAKQFISNGRIAKVCVLFAVTDPKAGKKGISCFVVPTDTPGFKVLRVEEKLGQHASDTCALAFEGMRVPGDALVGQAGDGYRIALSTLEAGRIGIAAQSVGMARAALDHAIAYAKERIAFDRPLIEHQAVRFRLVEARTKLEAARQLTHLACRRKDAGEPALEAACMAKLYASEIAEEVCSVAIQTLGGYGYLADYPVERIWRDVRVCQIYEGTSDVQKIILGRML
ncbi:acyl-CoA dehydrogenase family protein [Elioraea sp.]|uniref:acyl-CoA dehydrogenase family protein n=1 Tax=Elioraea sp. TaxID=2185103 RepID=UPI0021DB8843|nr:acyl-CoA dehydrogenase family protein [Elioraea sp.]GIX09388.1 MAG: acyl-CoA dehydrogenase [Elioraea sp.]